MTPTPDPHTVLAILGLVLAAIPALMLAVNLIYFRRPRRWTSHDQPLPALSVLIPARNEEARIGQTLDALLASRGVDLEILVMDDHSSDRTADIVQGIAAWDPRVRLLQSPALPSGWAGKQHACHRLAEHASHPVLVFLDADVEVAPDGLARAAAFLDDSGADLVSGFPRQRTGSFVERLVLPLIHCVLLGYLPFPGMRHTKLEAFAAGCGQLFLARRAAYVDAGGHGAIRSSFHDGIRLPRAFRRAGRPTDLFDATDIAACRMYSDARQVVLGLAKNAHEGMGGRRAIWVWSLLLLGGHVWPPLQACALWLTGSHGTALHLALLATGLTLATRLVLAVRFRQSLSGALLHPVGVALLVGIQWFARWRRSTGRAVTWRDRVQTAG